MKRRVLLALLVVANLLPWVFFTSDKAGMSIFFLGMTINLGTLAVSGLRLVGLMFVKRPTPPTNTSAMLGSLMGLFLGGVVGATSGLGPVMISFFNPDLPEQDFGKLFGAIGGGILGSCFFALLFGILRIRIVRPDEV